VRQIALIGASVRASASAGSGGGTTRATLAVHGEADDTVALSALMDWARPQSLPVTVVPGGGHFFHGQLPLLKNLVARHLRAG
jgi:alpha/beta superfamily hydrolase